MIAPSSALGAPVAYRQKGDIEVHGPTGLTLDARKRWSDIISPGIVAIVLWSFSYHNPEAAPQFLLAIS